MAIFKTVVLILSVCVAISKSQRIHEAFLHIVRQKVETWNACFNYESYTPADFYRSVAGKHPENYYQARTRGIKMLRHMSNFFYITPSQFDVRKKWPKCQLHMENVLDQGNCSNSWVLTPLSVMTDRLCIDSQGYRKVFLSASDVVSCCQNCSGGNDSCTSGGSPYAVWQFWVTHGIVSEECIPTTKWQKGNCQKKCVNAKVYDHEKIRGGLFYIVSSAQEQIKREIMKSGPVTATMKLPLDFFAYQDGTYINVEGEPIGQHMVKIIGWGTEDGLPYWLCMNTFGRFWGNLGGVFKIVRGLNHLQIESEVLTGRVDRSLDPRSERLTDAEPSNAPDGSTTASIVMLLSTISFIFT